MCHRQFKCQQCYDHHKQSRGNARPVCERLIRYDTVLFKHGENL